MKRLLHNPTASDQIHAHDTPFVPSPLRDTSAPCASGDKCVTDPPMRVEVRGEQCAACRRVQQRMREQLRARR